MREKKPVNKSIFAIRTIISVNELRISTKKLDTNYKSVFSAFTFSKIKNYENSLNTN